MNLDLMNEFGDYINTDICTICDGRCCRNMPGCFYGGQLSQSQIEEGLGTLYTLTAEVLLNPDKILNGYENSPSYEEIYDNMNYILSLYLDYPSVLELLSSHNMIFLFSVRPKAVKDTEPVGAMITVEAPNTCLFLTPTGCMLGELERPRTCYLLKPDPSFDCGSLEDKLISQRDIHASWLGEQEILKGLFDKWVSSVILKLDTPEEFYKFSFSHGEDINMIISFLSDSDMYDYKIPEGVDKGII